MKSLAVYGYLLDTRFRLIIVFITATRYIDSGRTEQKTPSILKGSDDSVQHSEFVGFWTLPVGRYNGIR
jgi:hypothetical protein